MRTMVLWICLVVAPVLCAEELPSKSEPPKPEQISAWIKDLGSTEFAVREEAEKKLRSAGDVAVQPLKAASQITENEELKARASKILEYLTVGRKREEAIKALGSKDWPTMKAGLDELFAELDNGRNIDADLKQAAQNGGPEAALARDLRNQLLALRKLMEMENRAKANQKRAEGEKDLKVEVDKLSQQLSELRAQIKNGMYDKAHEALKKKSVQEPEAKPDNQVPEDKK